MRRLRWSFARTSHDDLAARGDRLGTSTANGYHFAHASHPQDSEAPYRPLKDEKERIAFITASWKAMKRERRRCPSAVREPPDPRLGLIGGYRARNIHSFSA